MTNRNEGITIYLTIGKEVKLNFDSENNLSSIRLSINKVAELFGNKVVNEESIFYVSTVALVTKSNYKLSSRRRSKLYAFMGKQFCPYTSNINNC